MNIYFTEPLIEEVVRTQLEKRGIITNEDLDDIEILELSELGLSALPDLIKFTNLKVLNIFCNSINNIDFIEDLLQLEELFFNSNSISDLEPLAEMYALNRLELSYNNITDLTPLKDLDTLEALDLSYNKITDITPLLKLTKLKELHIEGNKVTNIDLLKNLDLDYLSVNKEQVKDKEVLKHIKNLVII